MARQGPRALGRIVSSWGDIARAARSRQFGALRVGLAIGRNGGMEQLFAQQAAAIPYLAGLGGLARPLARSGKVAERRQSLIAGGKGRAGAKFRCRSTQAEPIERDRRRIAGPDLIEAGGEAVDHRRA